MCCWSCVAGEDIEKMSKAIQTGNNPYYLESRVKNANDSKEIRKYLDVQPSSGHSAVASLLTTLACCFSW
jgi:hypothetical protein